MSARVRPGDEYARGAEQRFLGGLEEQRLKTRPASSSATSRQRQTQAGQSPEGSPCHRGSPRHVVKPFLRPSTPAAAAGIIGNSGVDNWADIIRAIFRTADRDGDGLISLSETRLLLRELDVEDPGATNLGRLFRQADADRDARLDLEEFLELLHEGGFLPKLAERLKREVRMRRCRRPDDQDRPEEPEFCPLCFANFVQPVSTPCGHMFCLECISMWHRSRRNCPCPMCRQELGDWSPDGRPRCDSVPPALEDPDPISPRRWGDMLQSMQAEEAFLAEQERLMALVPEHKAFMLRIGHRPRGSSRSITTLYVEPVLPELPLCRILQEVLFEFSPGAQQRVSSAYARAPSFEIDRCRSHIDPWLKAHVRFKEGLGIEAVSVSLPTSLAANASSRSIAVALPHATDVSHQRFRGDLYLLKKVLRLGNRHGYRGTI